MAKKGEKLSAEHRSKISASHRGLTHTSETRAKLRASHLGKTNSPETRLKISQSMSGRKLSDAHKEKIGRIHSGKVVSEESRKKNADAHRGRRHTEETKERLRAIFRGRFFSDEHRSKISASLKGRIIGPEWRANISRGYRPSLKRRDTGIERKVKSLLLSWGVCFEQQKKIDGAYGVMDFYLPNINGVVECDGTYWHSRPQDIRADERKNKSLADLGIPILRLPEDKINNDWNWVMMKLYGFLFLETPL